MNKKKEPVLCYFHFMYNEWNLTQAKKVFANTPCGWQYLWDKWTQYFNEYGLYGAITLYFMEALDSNLQAILTNAANEHYNGKQVQRI